VAAISYRRVLLKLGARLWPSQGFGIEPDMVAQVASKIQELKALDIEIAIVLGGGNICGEYRARSRHGSRHGGSHGHVGHVINCLALADSLERIGFVARVQTAIEMRAVAEPYIRLRAFAISKRAGYCSWRRNRNPYFTTDTAAALRAMEIDADLLIKATKVDGVYDQDR